MKHCTSLIFLIAILLILPSGLYAQETDFSDLIPEEGSRPKTFEDYLVQVAWLNSQKKQILQLKKGVADQEIKIAKKQWLRSLQFSASLSPRDTTALFNIPEGVPEGTIIPPFMNFGIGYSLGDLFTQKNAVKIKKQESQIYDFELNEEKLLVRREALSAYQKYLSSIEILKARTKAEEDAQTNYQLISGKFRKDKATFEEANQASISYHDAVEKRLAAESEKVLSKIQLEEILGVRWEKVESAKARYSGRKKRRN